MMGFVSVGKVTATSGTPVALTPGVVTNCNVIYIQALGTNTHYSYIGSSTMVRATLVGVYRIIPAPTAATGATIALPFWDPQSNVFTGPFDLSKIFLDVDTTGEGVLVSYVA
jgi:hypothetical protein